MKKYSREFLGIKDLLFITFPAFLREQFEEGNITIDHCGHWNSGAYLQEGHLRESFFEPLYDHLTPIQEGIFSRWMNQDHLDRLDVFIPLRKESFSLRCYHCGEKIGLETNGEVIRTTTGCEYPRGVPPFTLHLNIPSGKVVFANILHEWYDPDLAENVRPGDIDINSEIGLKLYSETYEPIGMITCFCGNSCPSIYKIEEDYLAVGKDGIIWGEDEIEVIEEVPHPGKHVGGVITDLWWWCAADYDDLMRRIPSDDRDNPHVLRHFDIVDVDVEPGEYKVTQYYHTLKDGMDIKPQTYATIRKT